MGSSPSGRSQRPEEREPVHPLDPTDHLLHPSDQRSRIRFEPIQYSAWQRGRDTSSTGNFSPLLQARNDGILLLETALSSPSSSQSWQCSTGNCSVPFKLAIMAYYHSLIHLLNTC
ncbi:hypothetical protein VPH35_053831 [Triticum aestivum]